MSLTFESLRRAVLPAGSTAPERSDRDGATALRTRIVSIDLVRGLVMVLMALDHTRDFFAAGAFNPREVTEPALFLTRWITHFCAPTFIFLAGISAYLYGAQGRSTGAVSRFLLTRGAWLVLIEFTVVRLGWTFSLRFNHLVMQVIFAIGVSMMALAALVYLPRWAIAAAGIAMIAGHNLLDAIKAEQLGLAAPIWNVLHQPGLLTLSPDLTLFVLYPLIPWIGVMAAGYALGPVFGLDRAVRRRWLVALGAAVTAGFVILRASNLYGDGAPWTAHDGVVATVLSFINCEKYPPSLLYLTMTIGPALLLLAAFENARGRLADCIVIFGSVPLFYYVAHLFLLHALAVAFAWTMVGDTAWLFGSLAAGKPAGRPRTGRRLCGVGGGGCRALSALPRLRGDQAARPRMVVELSLEHDPEKACPGLDPGWTPVFGKDHAPVLMTNKPGAPLSASPGLPGGDMATLPRRRAADLAADRAAGRRRW
jgi:uncharacterized membrane protein